jgi:hypothetical protein
MNSTSSSFDSSFCLIEVDRILIPDEIQLFTKYCALIIDELAAAFSQGEIPPAIAVFSEGNNLWLGSGLEFYTAARLSQTKTIRVEIRVGSKREAICNFVKTFGCYQSKRDQVARLQANLFFQDSELSQWEDREIAVYCGVTVNRIKRWRQSL